MFETFSRECVGKFVPDIFSVSVRLCLENMFENVFQTFTTSRTCSGRSLPPPSLESSCILAVVRSRHKSISAIARSPFENMFQTFTTSRTCSGRSLPPPSLESSYVPIVVLTRLYHSHPCKCHDIALENVFEKMFQTFTRSPLQARLYRLLPCNRTSYFHIVVYIIPLLRNVHLALPLV